MTALLPIPEWYITDQDGAPLAGGLVWTYQVDTTIPKATYQDADGQTQNSNPIVLNSAGRALVFGSGRYRIILQDSLGNLIYDQLTEAPLGDSAISAVMLPVLSASTLAEARRLMGIDSALQTAVANIQLMPGPQGIQGIPGPTGATGAVGPQGPAGASATGASADNYTERTKDTSVVINTPTGVVMWTFVGHPGDNGAGEFPSSWQVLRDGNRLYLGGPQADLEPNARQTPIWDRPGIGSHTYTVDFFIDAQTVATLAIAGIPPDWQTYFSSTAWCYLTVQSL